MKLLPRKFTHDGKTLRQLQHTAKVAIYELIKSQGLTYGYEVIRIRLKKEQEVFNRLLGEREVYPSGSDFGRRAWSFGRNYRSQAFERFETLVRAEHQSLPVHDPCAFQTAIAREELLSRQVATSQLKSEVSIVACT